jgi:hypothetical protein
MDKAERTSQGYLRAPAYLTRTGVLKYKTTDGNVIRELRHPDDVFKKESYQGLASQPLTNEHPKQLLNATNTKGTMIGWVGDEVEPEEIYLKSMVTIVDDDAIADVNSGKVELSCGYTAELKKETGIYNGEPYDVRQTNIEYNHVSLVKKGRAGENVRLILDSDDVDIEGGYEPVSEEKIMGKIKIGDKEFDASSELCDAIKNQMAAMDSKLKEMNDKMAVMVPKDQGAKDPEEMNAKLKNASKKADEAEARADGLEAELKELKVRMDGKDGSGLFQKAVAERVSLEKTAALVLKDVKLDGKSNIEIMKEVVIAKFPSTKLDGKGETYIQARYDHAVELIEIDDANVEKLKTVLNPVHRGDGSEVPSPEDARKKSWEADQIAWKRKV